MGKPTYSSTPAANIWLDPNQGKQLDLGSFKPARDKNPVNAKILPDTISEITRNVSSQASGEKYIGLTPVSSSSTRPSNLKRCGSLPSVSFGGRGLSFDPVATATDMWAEVDAAEKRSKTEDGASEAGRGEDSKRHSPANEPTSSRIIVKAEVHKADNAGTGDDVFVTAQEAQAVPDVGTEEHNPQNNLIVDMSEDEVQLGKKVVEGSESKESTLVSDSLINSIGSWQKNKISDPMGYRCNTDAYGSDNEPENDGQRSDSDSRFGLFD